MEYVAALESARSQMCPSDNAEFTGRISMKLWTRYLPEWAFTLSLDRSLRGLRDDMLHEYRRRRTED